jgi:hypothetical protein
MLNAGDIVLTEDRALAAACKESGATPMRSDGSMFGPAMFVARQGRKLRRMSADERKCVKSARRRLLELRLANAVAPLDAERERGRYEERALNAQLREIFAKRIMYGLGYKHVPRRNRQRRRYEEQAARARSQKIETIESSRRPRDPRDRRGRPTRRSLIEAARASEAVEALAEHEFEHRDEHRAWKGAQKQRQSEMAREREALKRAEDMLRLVETAYSAIKNWKLADAEGIYKDAAGLAAGAEGPDESAQLSNMVEAILIKLLHAKSERDRRLEGIRVRERINEERREAKRRRRLNALKTEALAAQRDKKWEKAARSCMEAQEIAKDTADEAEFAQLAESISRAEAAELIRAEEQQWLRNELSEQAVAWKKGDFDHIMKNHDDILRLKFPDLDSYQAARLVDNTLRHMLDSGKRPKNRESFRNYLKIEVRAAKSTPYYANLLYCIENLGLLNMENDRISYNF